MNKRLYFLLGVVIVASMVIAACGSNNNPPPAPTAEPTEVVWPEWSIRSCNTGRANVLIHGEPVDCAEILGGAEPNNVPTPITVATEPPAEAEATATEAPELSCLDMLPKSVNSNIVTWTINGDIGDRTMHGISSWTNQSGIKMLVVTQQMFNVDVETASMRVHWIYTTTSDMDDVFCAADELAREEGITQKFYIGMGEKPGDYSTELSTAEGFAVAFTMFTGEKIDTAPAIWDTIPFSIGDSHEFSANEGVQIYGQMQSGSNRAQHFQIREGYKLSTPAYQGTRWEVTNWQTVLDRVLARFTQMTQEVVEQRDLGVIIEAKVFCGSSNETVPPGYQRANKVPGYTCTKLP